MAEHFRDFCDPQIDPFQDVLGHGSGPIDRTLARAGGSVLKMLGAERLPGGEGQRWSFPFGTDNRAVVDMFHPEVVIPAWMRHHDLGIFYTLTGDDKRGPLWLPNTRLTTLADGVETGHPEADSMVSVVMALSERAQMLRRVGRVAARRLSPLRDARARAKWQQDPRRTKEEIWAHYDIDPAIYTGELGFLDKKDSQYSSGLLTPGRDFESLEKLQETKVQELVRKLQLKTASTVLEVGGGWGGLAVAIAKAAPHIHITSLTVSDEQLKIAQQRAADAGVSEQVQFLGMDYREFHPGQGFDRVVSVEMIEAVDWRDLGTYFDKLAAFVSPKTGLVVLQAITVRKEQEASQHHRPSFANTAIFPGGCLTSVETITGHMARRGFRLHERTEMGDSYALTLREWLRRFNDNLPALREKWKQDGQSPQQIGRFERGFNFYLAACQAGFRPETGPNIGVQQLVFDRAA